MKFLRIIAAVVATLAMLVIAKTNSRGQPEHLTHVDGQYYFEMTTVPKILEYQTDTLRVKVLGPTEGCRVLYRSSYMGNLPPEMMDKFAMSLMSPSRSTRDEYIATPIAGEKGKRCYYFIEVMGPSGAAVARFAQDDGTPFVLKYIGEVPTAILIGHLVFIFATVFCVALASIDALKVIRGSADVRPMAVGLFWAAVFCFIGGYPLGIPMNYYAFNGSWEGVPFGTDATDNKTQLLFVYLAFAALATLGSFSRGRFGRDLFAPRTLGWIGLSTLAAMLFIYLIPHSIQFSAGLTYAFCYTWIGLVAALYVFGLFRSRTALR